jgi:hypothetical protein
MSALGFQPSKDKCKSSFSDQHKQDYLDDIWWSGEHCVLADLQICGGDEDEINPIK